MATNVTLVLTKVNGKFTSGISRLTVLRESIINFFVKHCYVAPMVNALDEHNRKSEIARDIAASYRRCAMSAEFLDRMEEYDQAFRKFTRKANYHADKANDIADKLNSNARIKANNGYGIRPKHKPKYPRG